MRKSILFISMMLLFINSLDLLPKADSLTLTIARKFNKDIFDSNGVKYLQPMVQSINATSNSSFFNQAYVPAEVDKPYFRFGLHGMLGFVPNDLKTYKPVMPAKEFSLEELQKYAQIEINWQDPSKSKVTILDTVGLIYYAFQTIIYDGMKQGRIKIPQTTPTVLGSKQAERILVPHSATDSILRENPIFPFLPKQIQDSILNSLNRLPEFFDLPQGLDMNTMYAMVPQFEIGSLWGTELLIRLIPPVKWDENIGEFAFWGIGLKHSISQYFSSPPFDLAIQAVYQGTYLKNQIGMTKADLKANATIWNLNIHASKHFENIMDIYTGLSSEFINIESDYIYTLSAQMQCDLGILQCEGNQALPPNPPEYPGDTHPQKTHISLSDSNFKWILGISVPIKPVAIFLDMSISKFFMLSAGIEVRF